MLGRHDVVCPSVRLPCNDRDLGYRGLAVCVQQLGPVADDAAVLLRDTRKEPRHVDKGKERDVERIAEADKARSLNGGVDIEDT